MSESLIEARPEGTAAQLIAAAMRLFGAKGFAATTTREIAAAAEANVASIAYHFGGKDGLRRACGQEVMRRIGAAVGPAVPETDLAPEAAASVLEGFIRAMAGFLLTRPEAEDVVPFMLREVVEGGPVLDEIYEGMFAPTHARFCSLWSAATGRPADSETTRLTVFALIGQLLYFRIGRTVVTRRMGWPAIGPDEAGRIAGILVGNLRAIIERERRP